MIGENFERNDEIFVFGNEILLNVTIIYLKKLHSLASIIKKRPGNRRPLFQT